jgi:hypothetical protein
VSYERLIERKRGTGTNHEICVSSENQDSNPVLEEWGNHRGRVVRDVPVVVERLIDLRVATFESTFFRNSQSLADMGLVPTTMVRLTSLSSSSEGIGKSGKTHM